MLVWHMPAAMRSCSWMPTCKTHPKRLANCWKPGKPATTSCTPFASCAKKRSGSASVRRFPSPTIAVPRSPIPVDAGNFGLIDARVLQSLMALGERRSYLPGLRSWVGFKQIGIPIRAWPPLRRSSACFAPRPVLDWQKPQFSRFPPCRWPCFAWLGLHGADHIFSHRQLFALACHWFTEAGAPAWTATGSASVFLPHSMRWESACSDEYLMRIYDQVRGRPLYLVDRTANFTADEAQTDASLRPPSSADTCRQLQSRSPGSAGIDFLMGRCLPAPARSGQRSTRTR